MKKCQAAHGVASGERKSPKESLTGRESALSLRGTKLPLRAILVACKKKGNIWLLKKKEPKFLQCRASGFSHQKNWTAKSQHEIRCIFRTRQVILVHYGSYKPDVNWNQTPRCSVRFLQSETFRTQTRQVRPCICFQWGEHGIFPIAEISQNCTVVSGFSPRHVCRIHGNAPESLDVLKMPLISCCDFGVQFFWCENPLALHCKNWVPGF